MCGICGELRFDGAPVRESDIRRMSEALAHRGPDALGQFCEGPVGLGHRRLSIIDLSPCGNQPMWNDERSLGIVFNGEIYNYREIRAELERRGSRFFSDSDTEVILKAIECFGIAKALERFIGMFAFALWDTRSRELTLVRDRVGIKPLHYHRTSSGLIFASELKGLLAHPRVERKVNPIALGQTLITGFSIGEATAFSDTLKVPAAHYLTVRANGSTSLHKYWSLDDAERGSFRGSFGEAQEQLLTLLESAIGYRLVADVPVGHFHSGGVDSSLVSAIIKKRLGADIQNITIGFDEGAYDEVPTARRVSEALGVRHTVHYVTQREAHETLTRFCEIFDEPFGDTSGIPTYLLAKTARRDVKVALSADGGDEQFCGYESYGAYSARNRRLRRIPRPFRRAAAVALAHVPYRRWLSRTVPGADRASYAPQAIARYEKMLRMLPLSTDADLIRLMNEFAWAQQETSVAMVGLRGDVLAGTALSPEYLSRYRHGLIDAMMHTDYSTYLRDDILVKVDRASMAASLECRDPLLDHRIAEFAFRLPMEYLYDGREHKRILRAIARQWIPDDILSRPKRGFSIPLYYWLKNDWKPTVHEYLSRDRVEMVGILDPKIVEQEVRRFYSHDGHRAEKLWMLLNIQMWADRWQVRA